MKLTKIGTDYIIINEKNLNYKELLNIPRVHLIKLDFENPNYDKINKVLILYPKTNRFVIENNIKIYNDILRITNKKYYIENSERTSLITFFRKNNKVLLNVNRLKENEVSFILSSLYDVLRNIEVIQICEKLYNDNISIFKMWNGNVILI